MDKDTKTISTMWLRRQLVKYHIKQYELADAANIPESAISAFLNGREYLGPRRAQRIQEAIVRLSVDPADVKPVASEAVEPRIRSL